MMNWSQASVPGDGTRLVAVVAHPRTAVAAFDRAWSAGDAVLPLDPAMPPTAARRTARSLGAAVLVDGDARVALVEPAPAPAGTALVVRTSGSTGAPRGVVLGHAALRAAVTAGLARLDAQPDDRWLGVLPLHHVAGILVVLRARAAGHEPVLHHGFDVAAVAAASRATQVALVPTMLHRLLEHGADVARFRRILLGGAAPSPDLLTRAAAAGARVVVSYGMTETAGGCVYDGLPLDGVAVAVDPDDRVLVRGPVLADGYRDGHAHEPLPLDDGWLRTADLGRWDHGRLVVTGRADDVIVSGGVNVSSTAVAAVLRAHPGVADAAVVGVPDAEWGHRVVAYVVPVDAGHPPTLTQVRDHVRASKGAAAAPRDLVTLRAIPRTPLGKLDRPALRAAGVADGADASA
jgi:O-succinylbenzoic acid--CoA ligase